MQIGALNDGKAVINGIAIEGARKRGCHDGVDAKPPNRCRRLFSCAPTPEIPACDEYLIIAQFGWKVISEHFESMLTEALGININEIPARDDAVRVDIVPELEN